MIGRFSNIHSHINRFSVTTICYSKTKGLLIDIFGLILGTTNEDELNLNDYLII